MAQRNAFKTTSSFFRMLAIGAVGAKAVQATLNARGHDVVELERAARVRRIAHSGISVIPIRRTAYLKL